MLETLNRYCHGFVTAPVVVACRQAGFFDLLERQGQMSMDELVRSLRANEGHLRAAVRLMESLGWVASESGRLRLTPGSAQHLDIPDGVVDLLGLPLEAYLNGDETRPLLGPWIARCEERWGAESPLMADFLDGVVVVRLLTALRRSGALGAVREGPGPLLGRLGPIARREVGSVLSALGWIGEGDGQRRYTDAGRFMVDRALTVGALAAYTPMLSALPELLFGEPGTVFARGSGGQERHLDRALNVAGSGFQHERYFADVEEVVLSIFDRQPVSEQPRYVADMGCGDGTFLKRIYETIRSRSARGAVLAEHPLVLIGVDFNDAALEATARTLAGFPHFVTHGDIGDPERLRTDLAGRGIDPDDVLHVRSFLDHDRPFMPPRDRQAVRRRRDLRLAGVYVDGEGRSIPPWVAVQSLVEHLSRWAAIVTRHGLVALEVHCLPSSIVREHVDHGESLHFDAYHAFSMQQLVEARVFLLAAGEAGLFPRPDAQRRYPGALPFARITLNQLERRPFSVRPAYGEDAPALVDLETAAWPEELRTSAEEIGRRLRDDPGEQLVLEHEGRIAAALYTQRIGRVESIETVRYDDVATLREEGGPFVQLLGLCVHPDARGLGFANELLGFALALCRVQPGVVRVAGVTRCRDFGRHQGISHADYVRRRDTNGELLDTLLRFHERNGARVVGVVPGYRPGDTENGGAGVVIEYGLEDRADRSQPWNEGAGKRPGGAAPPVSQVVEASVRRVLGRRRESAYSPQRPLMEMGLDSMDLTEVKALLARELGLELEPTLFFQHRTVRALEAHLETRLGAAATGRPPDAQPPPSSERPGRTTSALPSPGRPPLPPTSSPRGETEGIAIVGLAGRFAGAKSAEEYWACLRDGRDAVAADPPERWAWRPLASPEVADALGVGGFLDQVDRFDAAFFGISPREARAMDPQQRMLLETTWHALEHAGIDPRSLAGSASGVFVGIASHDYELLQVRARGTAAFDAHFASGNAAAVAAGRLSYLYGLQGPALSVDTACSSSLVAVHQAAQSLRLGECDLALAGGVNVLLAPEMSLVYARARMLSPAGRCRTFDASADGYVRSEGCGIVVMKRLADALADGDEVLAVVRGSAINQDGPSNGLTAPNGDAQEAVIRLALKNARVSPKDVSYVEAHGTGTSLGDPVEVAALGRAYGPGRPPDDPLVVSTAKTTIGHLEAAAGVAGLIKTVLSLQHEHIPPHLHFHRLNPLIHLDVIPALVPTGGHPWPRDERRPRRAGVSSFGFSGTNAHVILEEAPLPQAARSEAASPAHLLVLSAKTPAALTTQARVYAELLVSEARPSLEGVCFSAATGRAHLEHRLAVAGESADQMAAALERSSHGEGPASRGRAVEGGAGPRLAFLFSGQGSQYPGMARQLFEGHGSFRRTLEECDEILQGEMATPLLSVLFPTVEGPPITDTSLLQPALFAVEYALSRLWQSWGILPSAVIGHSIGEYVAACVAGVFGLEDGLRLVAARGRLMGELREKGAMLAVAADESEVSAAFASQRADLSIACLNAPARVVVAGRAQAVAALEERLSAAGLRSRRLRVSGAFHSPLMDPILEAFEEVVARVKLSPPNLTLVSNVLGRPIVEEATEPAYWRRHLRETVRFADGIHWLGSDGYETFLEVGPGATLIHLGRLSVSGDGRAWLPSLLPDQAERITLLETLGALYVSGAEVDWGRVHREHRPPRIALPLYPFQRERFWFDDEPSTSTAGLPATTPAQPIVSDYYDALATAQEGTALRYLNFAPFPQVVSDFSWVLALGLPQRHSAQLQMFVEAQAEIRKILFRHADFQSASRVLDIGCGYGSDLLDLARAHPHLQLCGFSLSERQVEQARRGARRDGVDDRLEVLRKDSARDAFPPDNDVIFGFEVAHHIRDKGALFANVGAHLREGGHLFLADFVSTTAFAIEHAATSSFFPTRTEWADLLSNNGLEVIECVDVSPEIANSLHDPGFEANLQTVLETGGDSSVREAFTSYDQLGRLLRKRLALYVLLSARRRSDLPAAELRRRNEALLATPRTFAEVSLSGACYEVAWRPVAQLPQPAARYGVGRRWALLEDDGAVGEALSAGLEERGGTCRRLRSAPDEADGNDPAPLSRLRDEMVRWLEGPEPVTDVVHLWSLGGASNTTLTPEGLAVARWLGCGSLLELVRTVADAPDGARPRLWVVTRGAQPAGDSAAPLHLAAATLSGFVRTLRLEHPEILVSTVDLDPGAARPVDRLLPELLREEGPEEVALRPGVRLAPRLVRRRPPPPSEARLQPDATYLIAGGLGELGLLVARSLARRGARHLVLVGRRSPDEASAAIRDIERLGAQVVVQRVDISRRPDVAALLEAVGRTLPPLRGVVNAAGVLDDGVLRELDQERLERVMAPKVEGSLWLHEATRELDLEFFCCFSSVASVLGSPGQAHYAAANGFMDALALHRQRLGLPGLSVSWGAWEGVGMAASLSQEHRRRMAGAGFGAIPLVEGVELFGDLLAGDDAHVAVLPMDWSRYAGWLPGRAPAGLLADVVPQQVSAPPGEDGPGELSGMESLPPARRREVLVGYVRLQVAKVIGSYSASSVDPDKGFWAMGLDSLMSLELRNRLQVGLERPLPTTLTIDYPSVNALVDYLGRAPELLGLGREVRPAGPHPAAPSTPVGSAELDTLSEDETEALLLSKLKELEY